MSPVRIATRESDLALWQARHVARLIEAELGEATELVPLTTTGDRLQEVSLAKVGGKGLFVKEIEAALLDRRADVAVHSTKDLPGESPELLGFAAFPARADPRDALVSERVDRLAALPEGARVGTGSVRRRAQLLRLRPDLEIVPLRGNVPTRLRRLNELELDAVILACAGLDRLELSDHIRERIEPEQLLPAVGQGALAVQSRRDDPLSERLRVLHDRRSGAPLAAERACQAALGADCHVPLGVHGVWKGDALWVRARLLSPDGKEAIERDIEGAATDAERLGARLADALVDAGGKALLEAGRET
ncbi:MAG: hydroxymethylbilane synthase [Myxococcota bacterium]